MSKSIVLWVENDPRSMDVFRRNIEDDGTIEFVIKEDAVSAIEYMEDNFEKLSAAVLDVESYVSSDIKKEKDSTFYQIERAIAKLSGTNRNKIEYFAFTGKKQYLRTKQHFTTLHQRQIFSKGKETVEAQKYLREIVAKHHNTKIKEAFAPIFEVFQSHGTQPILKDSYETLVIKLIDAWDDYSLRNSSLFFGVIRPICEDIMSHLVSLGIVPDSITKWNPKSAYFGKLSQQYPTVFPCYIARSFHTIFDVCPEGVHSSPLFDDVNTGKTPFLLQSLSYELFNLMSWITDFTVAHPRYEENKKIFRLPSE